MIPRTVISSITVPFDDRYRFCSVLDGGVRSGVQFYFIDYPPFFDRDGLYGRRWAIITIMPSVSRCFRAPFWRRRKSSARPTSYIAMTGRRRWCPSC